MNVHIDYSNVFSLLTRMRQMACHPDLVLRSRNNAGMYIPGADDEAAVLKGNFFSRDAECRSRPLTHDAAALDGGLLGEPCILCMIQTSRNGLHRWNARFASPASSSK